MVIEPAYIAIGGGVALAALMWWLWRRRGASPGKTQVDPQLERDLRRGNYEHAAQRELEAGNLEAALDLFLRAQRVIKAAHIAEQLGRLQQAAELYELCGDKARAAAIYRKLGLPLRANELLAASAAAAPHLAPTLPPTSPRAPAFHATPTVSPSLSFSAAPAPTMTAVHEPRARAMSLEAELEALLRRVKAGEPEARLLLPDLANQVAQAWMSVGDLVRAAEVCRNAGLVEQAVNLYANLLGEPGAAAEILAQHGELRRAAELYELAQQNDKALDTWITWCRDAPDPLEHVAAVSRLGPNAVERLAGEIVRAHPLSPETVELHGRVGEALARFGAHAAAVAIFEALARVAPHWPGLGDRIAHARQGAGDKAASARREESPSRAHAHSRARAPESSRPQRAAPADVRLRSEDLDRLAAEVAERAVRRAARTMSPNAAHRSLVSRGLEKSDLALAYANDPAILEARNGPSTGELNAMIGDRGCDLINIEVFYRLGLAHVAAGRWEEARRAFAIVEETSRGYRDAKRRAEEIARWQAAVGKTHAAELVGESSGAVGRYTLLGELGRGGMAVVYRARDDALGREVALKFIAEGLGGDERVRALFEREARSVASLNHPNIVTVFDVGVLEGRPFICMELVEGHTIEQQLEVEGQLKILDALRVSEQVLAALEYAHDRKIMHRDVKPANMMRTKRGLVKLMDFGLAKSTEEVRKTTVISGTPAYMAPEQMAGTGVDGRADLYAVGASLHQMLSGQLAFDSLRRDRLPPPLSTLRPGVPRMLEWVVQRSLEFEPDARFSTATEMRSALLEILQAATERARNQSAMAVSP
jgi:tetratricopeptide (TPR) repeat protein